MDPPAIRISPQHQEGEQGQDRQQDRVSGPGIALQKAAADPQQQGNACRGERCVEQGIFVTPLRQLQPVAEGRLARLQEDAQRPEAKRPGEAGPHPARVRRVREEQEPHGTRERADRRVKPPFRREAADREQER